MDLDALGGFEAARSVLAGYRAAGGDPGDDDLVAFFAAYRALCASSRPRRSARLSPRIRHVSSPAPDLCWTLAERLAWRARPRGDAVVVGLEGQDRTRLPALLDDVTSTAFASASWGVAPGARAGVAAYGESFNRRTYAELGRLARRELEVRGRRPRRRDVPARGRPVGVPDGARRPAGRLRGRVPGSRLGPAGARSSPRRRRGRRLDADADVVRRQADDGGVGADVPADRHVVLRTDRPAAEALDDLAALLDARLARAVPSVSTHPRQRGPS